MSEFIKLLSSYNLFNSLLPGIIYVILLTKLTRFDLIQSDIVIGLFYYYFIGIIIGRFGSIIIEPIIKKIAPHADNKLFIQASKKDQTINIISEVNNMYRSLIAVLICLFLSKLWELLITKYETLLEWNSIIIFSLIGILLVLSYRKQTGYIIKRIDTVLKKGKSR